MARPFHYGTAPMSEIQPHKIRLPIQLPAAWSAAVVAVAGILVAGAVKLPGPTWVRAVLAVGAVVLALLFFGAAVIVPVKYRAELMDDDHYSSWLRDRQRMFERFNAENLRGVSQVGGLQSARGVGEGSDERRVRHYREQEGLFIVHEWQPSGTPGQVADIAMWLHQHGEGPLSRGEVERVEYCLGPKFFQEPVVKENPEDRFRLDVSAYGSMLCLARVYIRGRKEPVELTRYVNFFEELPASS
jgi:hypothetical protein